MSNEERAKCLDRDVPNSISTIWPNTELPKDHKEYCSYGVKLLNLNVTIMCGVYILTWSRHSLIRLRRRRRSLNQSSNHSICRWPKNCSGTTARSTGDSQL